MSETGADLWRYWEKGKIDADLFVFLAGVGRAHHGDALLH